MIVSTLEKPDISNTCMTVFCTPVRTIEPPLLVAVFCPISNALSPADDIYGTAVISITRSLDF